MCCLWLAHVSERANDRSDGTFLKLPIGYNYCECEINTVSFSPYLNGYFQRLGIGSLSHPAANHIKANTLTKPMVIKIKWNYNWDSVSCWFKYTWYRIQALGFYSLSKQLNRGMVRWSFKVWILLSILLLPTT